MDVSGQLHAAPAFTSEKETLIPTEQETLRTPRTVSRSGEGRTDGT